MVAYNREFSFLAVFLSLWKARHADGTSLQMQTTNLCRRALEPAYVSGFDFTLSAYGRNENLDLTFTRCISSASKFDYCRVASSLIPYVVYSNARAS